MRGFAILKRCTFLFLDLYTGHQNQCIDLSAGCSVDPLPPHRDRQQPVTCLTSAATAARNAGANFKMPAIVLSMTLIVGYDPTVFPTPERPKPKYTKRD